MKEWLVLFLKSFSVIFAGFILCNICAVTIDCLFDGFDCFLKRILDLSYVMYACFSVGISVIFATTVANKSKR